MIMKDDTLEKLAELEHVQWCEWADVLSDDLSSLLKVIEKSDVELSDEDEDEKEKDRVYARKVMNILFD